MCVMPSNPGRDPAVAQFNSELNSGLMALESVKGSSFSGICFNHFPILTLLILHNLEEICRELHCIHCIPLFYTLFHIQQPESGLLTITADAHRGVPALANTNNLKNHRLVIVYSIDEMCYMASLGSILTVCWFSVACFFSTF